MAQNDQYTDGVAPGSSLAVPGAAAPVLALKHLTLTHFRNYAMLRLPCDDRPVVLTGPNGAGKTNLLEAISFLVPGRGLRRARLADVASRENGSEPDVAVPETAWGVAAHVETPNGPVDIGTGCDGETDSAGRARRIVHIDGQTVSNQAVLAEHVNVQWLTPQMDRLFLEGASARRRFLDRLVFGFDPAHAGRAQAYDHALRERARLLRTNGARADANWLAALEETMATKGVAVAVARRDAVARLAPACGESDDHFPAAAVMLQGEIEGWLEDIPALAVEDRFRDALAQTRSRDAEAGGAAIGPHRSDLAVRHVGNGRMADQCSTGEQKALLIRLILAHVQTAAREWGRLPILLLDEVAAHLDEKRRAALIAEILNLRIQAWLTGTDEAMFAPFRGAAQFCRVDSGTVSMRPTVV